MKGPQFRLRELHWPLIFTVIALAALGCYNLHSAAAAHEPRLYLTQVSWFALGALLAAISLFVDYRVTENIAYILYAVAVALLVGVLVTGKAAMGARRWLILGPLTFQPSEIAKVAVILCLARYFSQRLPPGGYTIGSLVRPLNPTRPLAVIGMLALTWNKPFVLDPLGELARRVHDKLGNVAPRLENLLWFRGFLIALSAVGFVLAVWTILRAERAASLLNPWPPNRSRRLLSFTVLVVAAIGLGLFWCWHAPVLGDPFGVLITWLNAGAASGGAYETLEPAWSLRIFLSCLAGIFLLASLVSLRHRPVHGIDTLVAPLDLLAVPALMVLVQPDLGTAGILILIGMTMILVVGVQLRSLITMGIMGAIISGIAWFGVLKDYQKRRILTFIDPEQDIKGAGWNAVQSLIAVGSGRWVGKGHMGGTQTQLSFLPEQHTDFAFSVWAEEQGFMGCTLVLVLYLILLTLALAIAADARDTYGVLLATGIAALIMWQAVINVGMVIGMFPVVGITLPLFSYGGSSVLAIMLSIGLLLNIHWRRRAH